MGEIALYNKAEKVVEEEMRIAGRPFIPFRDSDGRINWSGPSYDTEAIWGLSWEEIREAPVSLNRILKNTPRWKREKRKELKWLIALADQREAQAKGLTIRWM